MSIGGRVLSTPGNPFEHDWEAFRFPVRPVRIFSDSLLEEARREEDGEGDASGEGGAGGEGAPDLIAGWHYRSDLGQIHHSSRKKRILLSDLDTGLKIIRLLAAIEARPELDVDGLIDALEFASWDRYGQDLGATLEAHSGNLTLTWTSEPYLDPEPTHHGPHGP